MLTKTQVANLTRWIEALLSDKYKKANGAFYEYGCYCATGVALKEFALPWMHYPLFMDPRTGGIDRWFAKKFGGDIKWYRIANMNDDGQSFAEIACYLSHFLPDSTRKAQLQVIIMQKLDAQEEYRNEAAVE